ncbi:hypothetical protein OKJ48_23920 [Streptomyces kunmingensis]|uniref:Uncharacterized protein n=1 Tax=Streptomyces kunmingensis TaxID=68225 RepID=A0ABU6CEZ6_9ACTN|nr:hypothetical protein [Streptomyces kunmingensis]MEB3963266.1 hypothetical protein [Streptomyces kunmingensis]
MSDQWPPHHPAPIPGPPLGYAPPHVQEISAGYRRWAAILLWLAVGLAALMAVAFVASFVLLALADADRDKQALGYLALILWVALAAAVPVLLGLGIPGLVMTQRVRRQRRMTHPAQGRGRF